MSAVADTGAQVCVAGCAMLSSLSVKHRALQRRTGVRDVADLPLKCLGSMKCIIELDGRRTEQEIYILPTAKNFYMSLGACIELGIVSPDFPHPPRVA